MFRASSASSCTADMVYAYTVCQRTSPNLVYRLVYFDRTFGHKGGDDTKSGKPWRENDYRDRTRCAPGNRYGDQQFAFLIFYLNPFHTRILYDFLDLAYQPFR